VRAPAGQSVVVSSKTSADPQRVAELIVVESYGSAGEAAAVLEPFALEPVAPSSAATGDADGGEIEIGNAGRVRLLGAVAIPGDEVVFYLVSAASIPEVRRAFEARGIDSVRIVAAEWVSAGPTTGAGRERAPIE